MPPIAKDRIERAARIYASNHDAGSALGIAPGSFQPPLSPLRHRDAPSAQAPSAQRVDAGLSQPAQPRGVVICQVSTKFYSSAT